MNVKQWALAPVVALLLAACADGEREAPPAEEPEASDEGAPPGVEPTQALACLIEKTDSRTVYRGCGTCGAGRNRGDKQTRQCLRCGTATFCSWTPWTTVGSTCASCGS